MKRHCDTCRYNVMEKYDDICDDCDASFKNWKPANGGPQMTNKKDREEARLFLNRLSHIYEEPADVDTGPEDEMIDAIIEYRAEAVKAERERCATKAEEWLVKMSYHGMNVFGADIPSIRAAIVSDDQETNRVQR